MWSSSSVGNNSSSSSKRICCSPSKSSSTCSSPSLFPPSSPIPGSSPKETMDDVWKDLTLSSLHRHPTTGTLNNATTATHHAFSGNTLQDFLSPPSTKDPSRRGHTSSPGASAFFAPSPTVLNLNSRPDFHYIDDNSNNNAAVATTPSFSTPSNAYPILPSFRKKKIGESADTSVDRRRKRLIKNRESAARSRARKQAYTTELEQEVAQLTEENEKLKRQQQKLCSAALDQLPKKQRLHRTSTAPF